jgi:hypothetical protein
MKQVLLAIFILVSIRPAAYAQNVGIGQTSPASKLDVNGGITIGSGYSGVSAAPASGAIIQGQVGIGTSSPNPAAILDITSTTMGVLIPRMTATQRNAISAPANGLTLFNTTSNCFEFYVGGAWQPISCGCSAAPAAPAISGPTSGLCATTYSYTCGAVPTATSYIWAVTGDATATASISGQGTTSITVTYSGTSGTAITCYASNTCGSSSTTSLPISFASGLPSSTISGYTVVGAAQTGVVYTAPAGATTYAWSVSGGSAAIVGGSTGSSITVSWSGTLGTSVSTNVNVTAINCLGSNVGTRIVQSGGTSIFNGTGAAQTFGGTNYDVTTMKVSLWGAGGGGDYTGGDGGSGAYVGGTIASGLTAAQTLTLVVGGYGVFGSATGFSVSSYGGGGSAYAYGAGGGGRSAIQISAGTDWVTAGGGGGGGYYSSATYGGAGGATTGTAGGNPSATYTGGSGGSVTAGGAGGLYNSGTAQSVAGSALQGGNALTTYTYGGGGGGGGYYGGGSGYSGNSGTHYSSGGGGGSSYVTNLTTGYTNTVGATGTSGATFIAAPSGGDPNYVTPTSLLSGSGSGGYYNTTTGITYSGGYGMIVLYW